MITKPPLSEPKNVLYRIKRGLAGYVSYLAACEMNEAFSEYVLYEPMLRILTARGYVVKCEYKCPKLPKEESGDFKRLDFVATGHDQRIAIEAKWAKSKTVNVKKDYEKLMAFVEEFPGSRGFMCIFGTKRFIENISLTNGNFTEVGDPVFAEFAVTKYGCRIFESFPPPLRTVSETVSES